MGHSPARDEVLDCQALKTSHGFVTNLRRRYSKTTKSVGALISRLSFSRHSVDVREPDELAYLSAWRIELGPRGSPVDSDVARAHFEHIVSIFRETARLHSAFCAGESARLKQLPSALRAQPSIVRRARWLGPKISNNISHKEEEVKFYSKKLKKIKIRNCRMYF